jgi:hypothetical protein
MLILLKINKKTIMPIIKTSNNNSAQQKKLASARFRGIFNTDKKNENKGIKRHPLSLTKRLSRDFSINELKTKYTSLIKNIEDKRQPSDREYRAMCIKTALQLKRQEDTFDKH